MTIAHKRTQVDTVVQIISEHMNCYDNNISQGTTFPTTLHVQPAKTDQPAYSRSPIRVLAVRLETLWIPLRKHAIFKYTENFYHQKLTFSDKKILLFFIFLFKTYIVGTC